MACIGIISLGCSKNAFDTEAAIANIITAGHEISNDFENIDVVIINTCGFIEAARDEADENIIDMIHVKKNINPKLKIIVTGCYSQKFKDILSEKFPQIDALCGIEMHTNINKTIDSVLKETKIVDIKETSSKWTEPENGRFIITYPWSANLKITEGCNNHCSYCAIPGIRGELRSRPLNLALTEAKNMAISGVKEIIVIGQDITAYGHDLGETNYLVDLLKGLNEIDEIRWIRLMYTYPTSITDELIEAIKDLPKVLHYIDMPIQHADTDILKQMNRRGSKDEYIKIIEKIRSKIPDITLRTTFIVGFPGENDENFNNLLNFVKEAEFDRAGFFGYSSELNTPAYNFINQIDADVIEERCKILEDTLNGISINKNKKLIGNTMELLVEYFDGKYICGRTYRDAPEIDGVVKIKSKKEKLIGEIIKVKITNNIGIYDLAGIII